EGGGHRALDGRRARRAPHDQAPRSRTGRRGCRVAATVNDTFRQPDGRIPAKEALELLRAGNERFAANVRSVEALQSGLMRAEHAERQQPFAIVLACSDSRVPVEILFDQGLGTLFVIRVAGNIVAPSQIGSIEYAAERFGTRL